MLSRYEIVYQKAVKTKKRNIKAHHWPEIFSHQADILQDFQINYSAGDQFLFLDEGKNQNCLFRDET